MKFHLACACDRRYAPHAAAMIESVLINSDSSDWVIHVLYGPGLDPLTREELAVTPRARGAEVVFHEVADAQVATLPQMDRIGSVMWYRVFLPQLLPDVERVLYVDCDTIAKVDLEPLLNTDLADGALGAVRNVFEPGQENHAARLGLGSRLDYFNSGVMLMDLDVWRSERLGERVLEIARTRARDLKWPDQDALNLALAGRWRPLHPRWNAMNSLFYFDSLGGAFTAQQQNEVMSWPGILHFEGGSFNKPWNYLCKHPFRGEYFRHRAATPWPEVEIERVRWRYRPLRLLPMRTIPKAMAWIERLEHRLQGLRGRAK